MYLFISWKIIIRENDGFFFLTFRHIKRLFSNFSTLQISFNLCRIWHQPKVPIPKPLAWAWEVRQIMPSKINLSIQMFVTTPSMSASNNHSIITTSLGHKLPWESCWHKQPIFSLSEWYQKNNVVTDLSFSLSLFFHWEIGTVVKHLSHIFLPKWRKM
jgi:hypothetical protein